MRNLLLILLFIPTLAFAQSEDKKHFQVGFGFSFGSLSPTAVNDYINYRISNTPPTRIAPMHAYNKKRDIFDDDDPSSNDENSEINIDFGGRIFMGYRANNNFGIEAFLEGNSAPQIVSTINDGNLLFVFNRSSIGIQLSYDIRLGKKHNIILGAGPTYNKMSLRVEGNKIASANAIGSKFTAAYQFNYKHIAPRIFIDMDYAEAKNNTIDLDYSGVQIGLAFSGLW